MKSHKRFVFFLKSLTPTDPSTTCWSDPPNSISLLIDGELMATPPD